MSTKIHFNPSSNARVFYDTLELVGFLLIQLLLVCVWLPIWTFRQCAVVASKLLVPGIGKPLSIRDVYILENYNARHVWSIVLMTSLKGDICLQRLIQIGIRNVLEATLEEVKGSSKKAQQQLRFPELKQIQRTFLGFRFWQDDPHFDVNNHVHEVFYDGVDTPEYFKSVEGLAGEFTGRPYPPGRSPWEIYIVRNFPDEEKDDGSFKTVVAARAHHSQMDAYSIMNLLHHFCGKPPILVPPAYILQQKNILAKGWSVRGLLDYCRQSAEEVKRHRLFKQAVMDEKRKRGEEVVRDKVHFGYSPLLPLTQVKAVASKFGVRVPALLSTLLAEGMSDVGFQDELGVVNAPYVIPLLSAVGTLTNHAHMSALQLPISKRVPLTAKLAIINQSYLEMASNPAIIAVAILGNILGSCPAGLSRFLMARLHYTPISITNFWMGSESYHLGGLECMDIRAALGVPGDEAGSMGIILGYKDHVRILFAGHDSLFSEADVKRIAGGMVGNLEKLMSIDV